MSYVETANLPKVSVTAVGSMPHTNAEAAVDLILDNLSVAPHIPQLSRADLREQMWIQCTEGLPRFMVDIENLSYYFDTSGDFFPEVETFYTKYLETVEGGPSDYFAIGPDYGKGIHLFLDRMRKAPVKPQVIKVQVTGPLSFALTITDENRKPIFYHDTFKDIAVKGMGLKALWLIDQFKGLADQIIVFFDEPCLSAYGSSAYLGVSRKDVVEALDEVALMVVGRGAVPGVHCCGNTDWGMLLESSMRIINFDAVDYMETMALYAAQLRDFLTKGGVLAWGAVPNDLRIDKETASDVKSRLKYGLGYLKNAGLDPALLIERMLITPACGCAGLPDGLAAKAYAVLSDLDKTSPSDLLVCE